VSSSQSTPPQPSPWCSYCRKHDHNDSECWSTRPADWKETPPPASNLASILASARASDTYRKESEALSSPDDKHDEQKIVCHAPGDRCHGCDHYKGKAPVCSFAPSAEVAPAAWIEHHKGGDNLVWDDPGGDRTPLYKAPQSATLPTKYVVRCGGECPQDWLCADIPEVQAALCEALYGTPKDACPEAIGWYLGAVQSMSPEELKREWPFEDGWLEVIKLRRPDSGGKV
jgi:hypothetical protein